jgi:hypothetical protein
MKKLRFVAMAAMALVGAGYLGWQPTCQIETNWVKAGPLPAQARVPAPGGYFRTGQWRADARTVVAALDFLLTPDPVNTNQVRMPA